MKLLEHIYAEWWPHREKGSDELRKERFWGKIMDFRPPVQNINEIIILHRALCKMIEPLMEETLVRKEMPMYELVSDAPRGQFQMRETFKEVVLIIEAGWADKGVDVICLREEVADKLGTKFA